MQRRTMVVSMPKCSFCGTDIKPGRGTMFVKNDGTIIYYCSSKCQRNAAMRNPVKVRWTQAYRKQKKVRASG